MLERGDTLLVLFRVQDPKAKEVHAKFVKAMEEAEEVMIKRNEDAASRTRSLPAGMEYTLLYPSTKTRDITPQNRGMTGRGVPCVPSSSSFFKIALMVHQGCSHLAGVHSGHPFLIRIRIGKFP